MTQSSRLLTTSVEVPRSSLGAYAPQAKTLAQALQALVSRVALESGQGEFFTTEGAEADLELRTVFLRLEPDSAERAFASVLLLVEVARRATGQVVYTRKAEAETRRLVQPPLPVDDPRFDRTALGRAVLSCLRGVFGGLVATFASG